MTHEVIEPKKHSVLGPSGAHRWARCAGSVVLEAPFREHDKAGIHAARGSVGHEVAEMCLYDEVMEEVYTEPLNAESFEGRVFQSDGFDIEFDMELADCVNTYCAEVHGFVDVNSGDTLLVENEVEIGHITGEAGGMGTSDVIGFTDNGKELVVIDLKTGRGVQVYAKDNEQMILYALGSLDAQTATGIERVRMVIIQPRLHHTDEWVQTVAEMGEHRAALHSAGEKVAQAQAQAQAQGDESKDLGEWREQYLNPGEKQCRFCSAAGTCPALRGEVIDAVTAGADDFPNLDEEPDALPKALAAAIPNEVTLSPEELTAAFRSIKLVETWAKGVRGEVERRLFEDEEVPGLGLFVGRMGARRWKSEDFAEELLKGTRLKQDDFYSKSLVSPTQLEKNIAKNNPRIWARAKELIDRADGKPTVDHNDCGKEPYVMPGSTAEGFEDLSEDDLLS